MNSCSVTPIAAAARWPHTPAAVGSANCYIALLSFVPAVGTMAERRCITHTACVFSLYSWEHAARSCRDSFSGTTAFILVALYCSQHVAVAPFGPIPMPSNYACGSVVVDCVLEASVSKSAIWRLLSY